MVGSGGNAEKCEGVSSDPFSKPVAVPLANVTDINRGKAGRGHQMEQDSLPALVGSGESSPPGRNRHHYPFPSPIFRTQTISGSVDGLRTRPIPPTLLKACPCARPYVGHCRQEESHQRSA